MGHPRLGWGLDAGAEVLERLLAEGRSRAEVYAKRGRSRRFELLSGDPFAGSARATETTIAAEEAGWSARAGDDRGSFFFASAGSPRPLDQWPAPVEGAPLELPPPSPIEDWTEPPETGEALVSEDEGWRLLRQVAADLERRLPGAALHAELEDGASEVHIWNHRGLDVGHRGRFAALRLEARMPSASGGPTVTLELVERTARRLPFAALADRLVDLLAVRGPGSLGDGAPSDMVLAPEVGARLLAPIAAAFVDQSPETVAAMLDLDAATTVASTAVTLIDDGRCARGPMPAPVDGEGVPTGARLLLDAGRLGETILPWERSGRAIGSRARAGWRDLPKVALSHCFVMPRDEVAPASLLGEIEEGFYLLDVGEGGSYDLGGGSFSLPVWGFRIARGRPLHPLGSTSLVGDPRRLLHAVRGVARDLRFVPLRAMIGSPSLLVRGLALRQD
jgi:predicted Zn-dependent protease